MHFTYLKVENTNCLLRSLVCAYPLFFFFGYMQFQILSSNFLQEAEWFHQNYIPCFTDHVTVSLQTGGAIELPVSLIVGMGDIATKEVLDWALANPDAGRAFAEVARFMDDLAASHVCMTN